MQCNGNWYKHHAMKHTKIHDTVRCDNLEMPKVVETEMPYRVNLSGRPEWAQGDVDKYFSLLRTELEKINFDPSQTFDVDETGISVVQHRATKVVSSKGKQQVYKLISAESGVTVVTCMSAASQYVLPLLIFPQNRWRLMELQQGRQGHAQSQVGLLVLCF